MIESVSPVFKRKISGFNIPLLLAFVLIANTLTVNAQEYARKITWGTKSKTMTVVGGIKITQPDFTGAAHL